MVMLCGMWTCSSPVSNYTNSDLANEGKAGQSQITFPLMWLTCFTKTKILRIVMCSLKVMQRQIIWTNKSFLIPRPSVTCFTLYNILGIVLIV